MKKFWHDRKDTAFVFENLTGVADDLVIFPEPDKFVPNDLLEDLNPTNLKLKGLQNKTTLSSPDVPLPPAFEDPAECIDQLKVLVSNVNICCSFSFRSLDDKLSGPADLFMASSPWHSWKPCSCGVRSPKAVIPWVEEGSREGTQVFVKNTDAPRCLLPCVTAWPSSAAGQVLLYNVYP